MPKTVSQEERQLVKLVDQLPLTDEDKANWTERIRSGEMSEELAGEIREKLNALPDTEGNERIQANRNRYLTELAMLIKRWRFSSQSHNFGKK